MSIAARFEMLLDMYSPTVEREDGTFERDPAFGIISKEDFLRLLEMPDEVTPPDQAPASDSESEK